MVNSGPEVKTGAWDPGEDDLLFYWQSKVGNKWSEVAKHIPGRTGQQCAQRWRHKVNPNIRRDKWTAEEDAKLIELVTTFGVGRWAEIARNCDGRTDQQCMGRWRRHLDPNIKRDSWSLEEDAKLRQLHAQHGTSWSRISKCLKGRTSQQCRARWHQINSGKACGGKAAASTPASASAANATGNKRGGAGGKRKPARRHAEITDSEEDEEPDDVEDDYEDEYEEEQQEQQYHLTDFTAPQEMVAAAAAAVVAAEAAYSLDRPVAGTGGVHPQLQQPEWDAAWAAPVAHSGCDDVTYGLDQEADNSAEAGHTDGVEHTPAAAASRLDYCGTSNRRQHTAAAFHRNANAIVGESWAGRHPQHGGWLSPSQQLFLSPDKPPRPQQCEGKTNDRRELDDEEAAGAETLLQMAHLLRRESCEFEPPSLRRSDFITASTPPKRTIPEWPQVRISDELSPSPFKRARSSRGALFVAPAAAEQGSMAPARTARRTGAPHLAEASASPGDEQPAANGYRQQTTRRHDNGEAEADNYMDSEVGERAQDDLADDAAAVGFGLVGSSYQQALPHPARPSNASCLTAAGDTAAAFLSPPPVPRVPGSNIGRQGGMTTPRRPTAQQNLMNLLGSPSFDRMPGYASPPSAGRTQPSAATLAALQSPQPSCVHEPFWTPFTGLVKDGVLNRGTSATPDLFSGGKGRGSTAGMFSPLRRSGSTGSRAMARRSFLASPLPAERSQCAKSESGHTEGAYEQHSTADGGSCQDPGPSPACGLQQQMQQVHHRVVRRLDQHEAWGTSSRSSPSKRAPAPRDKDGYAGAGFSLFSPVKKQPVPLFNDGSNIGIGVSPAKQSVHDMTLTIAPLLHHLPSSSTACDPTAHSSSSTAGAPGVPYDRSPLGPREAGRPPMMSSRRPSAHRSLLSPVHGKLLHRLQEQRLQPVHRTEEQGTSVAAADHHSVAEHRADSPMVISPSDAQGPGQQQEEAAVLALEQQGSASFSQQGSEPDTPVHLGHSLDTTSCSGTPNTPAEQQPLAGLMGAAAPPSPSDFVTPQHRQRPSRPLAPLHKDCLMAAATRSLAAGGGEAALDQAPAATVAAVAGSAVAAVPEAATAGAMQAKAADVDASSSTPGSTDSSKVLSPDRLMDSPLQVAVQQLQSPSQWHQGMVVLMRNLQQTPLKMKDQGGDYGTTSCHGKVVGDACAVKAGSRALRRLQAELERSSSAVATIQQQQQHGDSCEGASDDAEVPFPGAGAVSSSSSPAVPPACAPMSLPSFDTCTQKYASISSAGIPPVPTPAGIGHSNAVASVSLTPAVINCSKAEVLAMQGPGAAAVAWPVQQGPDGGLMVDTNNPVATATATSMLQLTPPTVCSKPPCSSDKENSSVPPESLLVVGRQAVEEAALSTAATAVNDTVPGPAGSHVTIVSIQPMTMVMGSNQLAQLTTVQPLHSGFTALHQPGKSISDRSVNSHAVRSRLHALIDSVQ